MSLLVNETAGIGRRDRLAHGAPGKPFRLSATARRSLKRAFDVCASGAFLLMLAPVLILISLMVLATDGRPVVFRHTRVGRGGRSFDCLKFRSMIRDGDRILAAHLDSSPAARAEWEETRKLRDDPRVLGHVGRFLRKSSLDELPQLFNVLRGEMSLVGPRPIVTEELVHYEAGREWYFSVRPGITGPWQVGGRSDTSLATRVRLDVQYAKCISLRRDLAILFRTVAVVLRSKGAY